MVVALSKGYLCPSKSLNGKVHSVFSRSVNIITDCKETPWISLLDISLPATPTAFQYSLSASVDLRAHLYRNDPVFIRGGVIRFPSFLSLSINTLTATNWKRAPILKKFSHCNVINNLRTAEKELLNFVSKNKKTPINSIDEYLQLLHIKVPNCIHDNPELLITNIGKGEGLTPSGDDFLIGVLAVLSGLKQCIPETDIIFKRLQVASILLSTTTDISAHYLELALAQHFSEPVQWLVYRLFNVTKEADIQVCMSININIGASSGADTAAGIIYCINKLLPI
ncbi:DUF2877 domain-containing protein [Vibrio algarum]|uniref:DUF2877 domain-containing protein n=1 Tax=Vibrio algarum TaxID=3020714 RepID=A0ABT4YV46_9VIBR|nr:DUF2877 domain-containing protein [Vibrio sp. KJ40-1]MDB1125449.1 DUF2877 domain-containing protein [Vibrio sp. KJ40-1]